MTDRIISHPATDEYRCGWDAIWGDAEREAHSLDTPEFPEVPPAGPLTLEILVEAERKIFASDGYPTWEVVTVSEGRARLQAELASVDGLIAQVAEGTGFDYSALLNKRAQIVAWLDEMGVKP